jgi:hypothetical protein
LDNYISNQGEYFTVYARPAAGSHEETAKYVIYDRTKGIYADDVNDVVNVNPIGISATVNDTLPNSLNRPVSAMSNDPTNPSIDENKRLYVHTWEGLYQVVSYEIRHFAQIVIKNNSIAS